ncbi:MAG: ankyrin repeat domain-containing protein [Xanthomonadales bacterium]|nr:ankyrin repeat domain-containing protein [Xanthomonadales bacterium]
MQKPAARPRSLLVGLARFLPALLAFALAIPASGWLVSILLLIGDVLLLAAVCASIGFDMEGSFARSLARRGLASLIALALFAVFIAGLLALPTGWLLREPSLGGALALSAAFLLGLLSLWRIWPVFALPLVWDDAWPEVAQGFRLTSALRRSLAFARHLTGEHELFFSHGLPAALAVLVISVGALALGMFGGMAGSNMRLAALLVNGLLIAPLASLTIATRCANAMFADARQQRSLRQRESMAVASDIVEMPRPAPLMVDSIADPDATLLAAARSAQIDMALQALELGANPNTAPLEHDRDQRSVLVHAVILPDLRLLRALISKGVDINRSHVGLPPLIAATRDSFQGRPDAVMTLLANGADPAALDASGNTALHHAALCGEPIVAALLVDAGVPINAVNREGLTALGNACANGNWILAGFLLEHGAAAVVEHAQPVLLMAAGVADDDPVGVKLLSKRKIDVDARGSLDRTALMVAALAGHVQIAEALLAAGANADLGDRNGTSALMEAARSGSVSIIHALRKRKVDPNGVDALGRSALIIACGSRTANEEVVRALLALGANPGIAANDGRRALDHALASGRWPIVALLDPTFSLPSNLAAEAASDGDAEDIPHLLDALRFGHWDVAESMRANITKRSSTDLARLYFGLLDDEHDRARNWVCNLGLAAGAELENGKLLSDSLIASLPASCAALRQLASHGVPIGGAGVVASLLARAPVGADNRTLVDLVVDLVERGADCCGRGPLDASALHLAAALGETHLVEILLARGADPNGRDARGRMPLHHALKASGAPAIAVVRALIAAGADPERPTESGETPLGLALARADRDLVYWLNWPRWRLPGRALRGPDLPAAAASGDIDAIDKLLGLSIPVDSIDSQGASALIRAAGSGYAALVVRLLDAGANPRQTSYSGATCLSAAVSARREAVVRTLLQHEVDADQALPGGGTPLMIAAALGLPRLAEPLLEHRADPNCADDRGNTALQAAAQFAFDSRDTALAGELLELLLRHGARIDMRNQAGQDALLMLLGARAEPGSACDAQHLGQLAKLLIHKGASVSGADQRGISPLHACALHGLLGVARLLKSHDAPITQTDTLGRTAGEVASLLGYVDVASELGVIRSAAPSARLTLRKRVTD